MKVASLVVVAAALAAVTWNAAGQTAPATDHSSHHPAAAASAPAAPLSEGEVRKVDRSLGKVTLRHGPLVNLDMPGMTMVFTAVDKKILEGLKEGDKVRFTADKQNGAYVVTAIQVVR
jgi:Cu(I)/Ag(I) efflux system periplasmic protein CusF